MQKPDNFWWQNYIEAQLWAFYTLSNSYSSSVTSQYEQVFTSFWMLLSYVIFAYNLLVLKNILQDMNSASENYKKELTLLNRYMKRKKIDLELQREINSHVVKHFEQEISAQFDAEKQALTKLSPQMRNKLVLESNKHIINQFPFFSNLSKQTTSDLYQIIEEECHAEGQEIQIFEKKTQEYFLYLIISGKGNKCYLKQQLSVNYFFPFHIKVEILQSFEENCQDLVSFNQDSQNTNQDEKNKKSIINQAHQKQICILKDKQTFGEYEFISNTTLPYIARCHQKTLLIKISSLKFQEIIKRNQQDLQKIMELKQRIYLSKQIELLKFQCVICKEKDHHFVNCYLTHFNKSPYYIIKKNNFSKNQERSNAQKRDCKKQQRFILELKTQQAISNYDENTEITSHHQIHSQMEDETSIFNQGNHSSYIQNKFKFSREESQSETSDSQESQTNEDSQNQFKKIHSLKAMRRASVKSNNCSIKHLSKASEMQEQLQFQDKKELIKKSSANIDDRLPPQNTDDKSLSIFLNNSQNNLSEQTPSQTVLYPVILAPSQFNKSVNQIPSNKIIKKQTQFQNQIQLGSIPEIDQFHKQQDQQNKHSEQTQNNIFRRSSLAPTNTVLGKRFSVRNRYSISFQSHAKIENEAFKKVWDGSSLYWAFDKAVNYIYFFPQYNYKNIIRNIYHLKGKKITQKQVKKPII